jgi:ubiquinone/menaquinone biosynthesis C-methylase UbiE
MEDRKTICYFDDLTPEYPVGSRYTCIVEMINKYYPRAGASLIDIGCGSGNVLQFVRDSTPVENLVGMDVSESYLTQVKERLKCDTVLGSILDDSVIATIANQFDFAVMGSVLHHLVGRTRKQSRRRAKQAISNALRLLKDGGYLLIYEPTFYPSSVMDAVFYTKKLIAMLTSKRVELFATWANIGMPIVSFYTNEQLVKLIDQIAEAELVHHEIKDRRRFALMVRSSLTTLVIRRAFQRAVNWEACKAGAEEIAIVAPEGVLHVTESLS